MNHFSNGKGGILSIGRGREDGEKEGDCTDGAEGRDEAGGGGESEGERKRGVGPAGTAWGDATEDSGEEKLDLGREERPGGGEERGRPRGGGGNDGRLRDSDGSFSVGGERGERMASPDDFGRRDNCAASVST